MYLKTPSFILLLLVFLSTSLSCSQCEDTGAREDDGWQIGDGIDAGDAAEATCDLPPALPAEAGVRHHVLLSNAGWGAAFGHVQEASSWGVVTLHDDGQVEFGAEHVFYEDEPAELIHSGQRAYVTSQFEPRVLVLDKSRQFEVAAEYNLDLPDSLRTDEDRGYAVQNAAYDERLRRHFFAFRNSPILAVVDACAEDTSQAQVDYLDLSESLGEGSHIVELFGWSGGPHLLGVADNAEESILFAVHLPSNTVVDVDLEQPGVQVHRLPTDAASSDFWRFDDGSIVVSVGRGSIGVAQQEIGGGLLRLGDETTHYEPGEYLVTAQQLGGNPIHFVMLDQSRGVVVVHDAQGISARYFEVGEDDVHVVDIDLDSRGVGLCMSPDGRDVWFPSPDGIYQLADGEFDQAPTKLEQEFEVIAHDCIFGP